MAGKVAARKAALRNKLIDLAESQIAVGGLAGLRARDLARDAGCALGAIYTHFDDLHALTLEVNGRTFARLGDRVSAAVAAVQGQAPHARLIAMAHAYLGFATEHPKLWRALFDIELTDETDVPEWYDAALGQLFAYIHTPVSEIFPDFNAEQREMMTRTLFSSVHGIVLLGVENRIAALPEEQMQRMISLLLEQIGEKN